MVFPAGRFVVVPTAPDYSLSGGNESRPVRRRPDAGLPHDVLPPRPEAVLARPACFQSPPLESDPSDIPRPRTDTQAPYGKQRTGGLADPPVVLRPSPEPRINRHPTSTVPLRYIYHVESLGGGGAAPKPCVLYPSEVLPPNPRCYVCSNPGPATGLPARGIYGGGGLPPVGGRGATTEGRQPTRARQAHPSRIPQPPIHCGATDSGPGSRPEEAGAGAGGHNHHAPGVLREGGAAGPLRLCGAPPGWRPRGCLRPRGPPRSPPPGGGGVHGKEVPS